MRQELSEQEVKTLEKHLKEELKKEVTADAPAFTVEGLRSRAKGLSKEQRHVIQEEVSQLFPEQQTVQETVTTKPVKPRVKLWKRSLAGIAAALILILLAPMAVNGAVDIPGIGVWVQQVALRDAGISWAYEHGYVQGTLARVSGHGVNMRILGVVADPVQTTVIYLLQGVNTPEESPMRNTNEAENAPRPPASVAIKSVNGAGVGSWTSAPARTAVGLVGMVSTGPLGDGISSLEVAVRLANGHELSLTLDADRDEISRLAEEYPLEQSITKDGITISSQKMIVTPSQVVVEYTMEGGQSASGMIPDDLRRMLKTPEGVTYATFSHGSLIDGVRHMREVFSRPADLTDAQFIIPALAKTVPVEISWSLGQGSAVAELNGVPVVLRSANVAFGEFSFELMLDKSQEVWSVKGFEVEDANGRVHVLGHAGSNWWHPADDTGLDIEGTRVPLPDGFSPVTLRATQADILVSGQWVIELGENR